MDKKDNKISYVIVGILSILLVITVFQSYQISLLTSEMENVKITGAVIGTSTNKDNTLQQILEEITPKGTPDYGEEAGVSYDKIEESLRTLVGYRTISLNGAEEERYNTIANTEKTACHYCCGASRLSQNCGCSHNIALQGLVKWLIKNTEYSNDQILGEIRKWQILFFPRPTLQEELEKRNINPESVGLPAMRGGC
jgi:hypothetical protein